MRVIVLGQGRELLLFGPVQWVGLDRHQLMRLAAACRASDVCDVPNHGEPPVLAVSGAQVWVTTSGYRALGQDAWRRPQCGYEAGPARPGKARLGRGRAATCPRCGYRANDATR